MLNDLISIVCAPTQRSIRHNATQHPTHKVAQPAYLEQLTADTAGMAGSAQDTPYRTHCYNIHRYNIQRTRYDVLRAPLQHTPLQHTPHKTRRTARTAEAAEHGTDNAPETTCAMHDATDSKPHAADRQSASKLQHPTFAVALQRAESLVMHCSDALQ